MGIVVERTGGFAGIGRQWSVTASADDAQWRALIEACPWDRAGDKDRAPAAESTPAGADRFSWSVVARCGEEERRVELAEQEVSGAWRELIEAVRTAAAGA